MHLPRSLVLRWLLVAVVAVSIGCAQTAARDVPASKVAAPQTSPEAPAPRPHAARVGHPDPAEGLDADARAQLAEVLRDEFCPCGCPHTLQACLAEHDCVHARRSARLAAGLVRAGVPASEVLAALATYYQGFRAPRAPLEVDARQCMGNPSAAVTLVEFSDFECPYCAAARPLLEAFAREHAQDLRFCSLTFPLPMHPNARAAGEAVLFAREQGRFWPMHDALFEHQDDLGPAALPAIAKKAGLDPAALRRALAERTFAGALETQQAMGRAAGVQGTPTLYFNGRRFTLPLSTAHLAQALEEELEWTANGGAWAAD